MGISKAERIRQMYEEGYTVSEIAKALGIRYQHAYNVVHNHLEKRQVEVRRLRELSEKQAAMTEVPEGEVSEHVSLGAIIRRILGL